ncbi:MAG: hypothetical protein HQL40_07490, partial [Alphaproteobacteria bacterium]|nr:hypothetical protein [Alphaproteobacteria bacterium]
TLGEQDPVPPLDVPENGAEVDLADGIALSDEERARDFPTPPADGINPVDSPDADAPIGGGRGNGTINPQPTSAPSGVRGQGAPAEDVPTDETEQAEAPLATDAPTEPPAEPEAPAETQAPTQTDAPAATD